MLNSAVLNLNLAGSIRPIFPTTVFFLRPLRHIEHKKRRDVAIMYRRYHLCSVSIRPT